jgi:hypothetical protein
MSKYMTMSQAAVHCGVHFQTLRRYLQAGILKGTLLGKFWVFEIETLDAWNAKRKAGEFDKRKVELEAL